MIRIADLQTRSLPVGRIRRLAELILDREGRQGSRVSFAFVADRRIRALNRRFLRHDFATDVLAFPLAGPLLGEVVISTDTAAREAKSRGIPYEEELLRYVAHGTLHLLGYEDVDPRKRTRMWRKQESYLRAVRRF